ncbi:hypothetical protein [Chitinimonas sp. BJYL2]|uniref:hypothetical protein n=1 Tax=Chitinimonas sp. BJYL2 TaxID=2976696 RepID=UPI0022B57A27|nr:hypothetical protein [Chitinimonas sp. BJYL2]
MQELPAQPIELVELGAAYAAADPSLNVLLGEAIAGRIDLFVRCPRHLVPISDSEGTDAASALLLGYTPDQLPLRFRYMGDPKQHTFDFPVRQESVQVMRLYPESIRGIVDLTSPEVMFFNGWLVAPQDGDETSTRSLVLSNSPYTHLQLADRTWQPNYWFQDPAYRPLEVRWTELLIDARYVSEPRSTTPDAPSTSSKVRSPSSPSPLINVFNQLADVYFGGDDVEKNPFKAVKPGDVFDKQRAIAAIQEKLIIKKRLDRVEYLCRAINLHGGRGRGVHSEHHKQRAIKISAEERARYPSYFSDVLIVYNECARKYEEGKSVQGGWNTSNLKEIETWLTSCGVVRLTKTKESQKSEQDYLIQVFQSEGRGEIVASSRLISD